MPRVRNTHLSSMLYASGESGILDTTEVRTVRPSHPYLANESHARGNDSYNLATRNPWPTPSPSPSPPSSYAVPPTDAAVAVPLPSLDSIPQSSKHQRKSASKRASSSQSSSTTHIPRPRNAYVLYRSWALTHHPSLTGSSVSNKQDVLSKLTGALWNSESDDVRAHFEMLSREEKERHAVKYPGYSYLPKKGLGTGAAKVGRMSRSKVAKESVVDDEDDDDDAEYTPSARSRSSKSRRSVRQTSAVRQVPTPEPTPDPTPFLSLPSASSSAVPEDEVDFYYYCDASVAQSVPETYEEEKGAEGAPQTPYLSMFSNIYLPPTSPSTSTSSSSPRSAPSDFTQVSEFSEPVYEDANMDIFEFSCPDTAYITPDDISSVLNTFRHQQHPFLSQSFGLDFATAPDFDSTGAYRHPQLYPSSATEAFVGPVGPASSLEDFIADLEDRVVGDMMERYLDF